jgi:protein-L-isoaspartate(D-aspartate) O-methyltransferase
VLLNTDFLKNILNKKVSPAYAAILILGVFSGAIAGTSLKEIVAGKTEKAHSWDDLGITAEEVPETGLATVEKTVINTTSNNTNNTNNTNNISNITTNANTYNSYTLSASVPVESESAWTRWMIANRPDSHEFLHSRWQLAQLFINTGELKRIDDVRAFLLTPREKFVRPQNKGKEYADTWLPIGWGATITDPDVVAMMTTTLNVQPNDKVLEIGTGSGYQAAILSCLSSRIYTIEIIEPLFFETDALYQSMETKYPMYKSIHRISGDGYYGWDGEAPFDKIIVTCSIDHIPPPLLQQLRVGGIMVLPLGAPGRQYIMEIKKSTNVDGTVTLKRRDVYNGLWVSFIPFRNESGSSYSRTN